MQPTEHKQPTEEELIAHIRESLMAHEEPYKEGAWEKFNEQEPKRRPIFWLNSLSGIAALLAVCFGVFLILNKKPLRTTNETTKTAPLKKAAQPIEKITPSVNSTGTQVTARQQADQAQNEQKAAIIAHNHTNTIAMDIAKTTVAIAPKTIDLPIAQTGLNTAQKTETKVVAPAVIISETPVIAKNTEEKTKPNMLSILANDTKNNEATAQKKTIDSKESKWALGVVISPSFGNSKKLNMGYGLTMGYSLSDKIALTSGIAYNEMNARKEVGLASSSNSLIVNDAKSLEAVSEKVMGLDIPLEVKYQINKNVYANVGVSAFAVLGQKRNNTFLKNEMVYGPSGPTGSAGSSDPGGQFANSYAINKRDTEEAKSSNVGNYLGFYNLSFGYKQKISKKNFVAIEPFMKLPIKEVSKENLRLMGTGLRLRFDF